MATRNPNPDLPPDAHAIVSEVNFTTTRAGLTGQVMPSKQIKGSSVAPLTTYQIVSIMSHFVDISAAWYYHSTRETSA